MAQQIFADDLSGDVRLQRTQLRSIGQTEAQWPPMGRDDLYYGGTVYDNTGGVGVRYADRCRARGFGAISERTASRADLSLYDRRRMERWRRPQLVSSDGETEFR